ncbi:MULTISPECIES: hypothetical protein [Acinetobacter]|uniref:hypothetical protein n=1 Tax=Acinetobacter TaxID=469 RepID=UPI001F3A54D8|nr:MULTISPECIES: hypothetical protein [Acinetobacter]
MMPQYLTLAENVIESIKEEGECESDRKIFFTLIILHVRKQLKTSHLKINQEVCNSIFEDENHIADVSTVDLSLIPRIDNDGEFLLWLAGFIQQITIDENKEEQLPLSTIMRQSVKSRLGISAGNLATDVDYGQEIKNYFLESTKNIERVG